MTSYPDWQPIETAPKDGSEVILYSPHEHPRYVSAKWYSGEYWSGWLFIDEALADLSPEGVDRPTHWFKPIPPEPSLPTDGQLAGDK